MIYKSSLAVLLLLFSFAANAQFKGDCDKGFHALYMSYVVHDDSLTNDQLFKTEPEWEKLDEPIMVFFFQEDFIKIDNLMGTSFRTLEKRESPLADKHSELYFAVDEEDNFCILILKRFKIERTDCLDIMAYYRNKTVVGFRMVGN